MATILDPTSGVGTKVSGSGALHVTAGGDGFPTYVTRFGNARLTTAYNSGTYAWAMRASATKAVDIRMGAVRMAFDGTAVAATQAGLAFVRFSAADPAAGNLLVPERKNTTEVVATAIVREGTATAGPTLAGATVAGAASTFGSLWLPISATGTQIDMEMTDWTGFLLQPGEGLAMQCQSALPIGISISGWLEYSER